LRKIIVAAAYFIAFSAVAGPFGLNKGMTIAELNKHGNFMPTNQQFVYASNTLINGHPDFMSYFVVLTPEHGLCKIEAFTKDIDASPYGTELEDRFKELISALTEKYGAPGKSLNFLRSGSVWKEPRDWMMSLLKKERTVMAFWAAPEILNLPDALQIIMVNVTPVSSSKGYLKLGYEFDNANECLAKLRAKKNSNL
jgi:hypothetical protein